MLCCDKCPRVFHLQCSGLDTPPEDDGDWVCPVCKVMNNYIIHGLCLSLLEHTHTHTHTSMMIIIG